jgi:regulator of nucleoside diphosphate kinase
LKEFIMTPRNTTSERQIIITEVDYDRLTHLIKSPRYRSAHWMLTDALQEELGRGRVVSATRVPKNVITMHSRVRVQDLDQGDSETYTLVYPNEANIEGGKLSILAPLARSLLGARVGQVVDFNAPAGPKRLKVLSVLYQPEAAGDFHL